MLRSCRGSLGLGTLGQMVRPARWGHFKCLLGIHRTGLALEAEFSPKC